MKANKDETENSTTDKYEYTAIAVGEMLEENSFSQTHSLLRVDFGNKKFAVVGGGKLCIFHSRYLRSTFRITALVGDQVYFRRI